MQDSARYISPVIRRAFAACAHAMPDAAPVNWRTGDCTIPGHEEQGAQCACIALLDRSGTLVATYCNPHDGSLCSLTPNTGPRRTPDPV